METFNQFAKIKVRDVTAHSFGVGLYEEKSRKKLKEKVFHLIKKNTPLPCIGAIYAFTLYKKQTEIEFPVYRTNETIPRDENQIGMLTLKVSKKPYYVRAVCLFELSEDGLLTFSSAEIQRDSPLVKKDPDEVDIPLLRQLIAKGEIKPTKVVIETK